MQTRATHSGRAAWPLALFVLGAIAFVLLQGEAPPGSPSRPTRPGEEPATEPAPPALAPPSAPREPATAPAPAALEVHVAWDDGRPLPGVRLLFTRGEELLFVGQTSAKEHSPCRSPSRLPPSSTPGAAHNRSPA